MDKLKFNLIVKFNILLYFAKSFPIRMFLPPGGMAARVSDMFCKFYLVKNHRIANNSITNKAREKISTGLEYSEF
jgi:hypothetical protein